jgi:SulP family sulfate permease
MSVVIFNTLSHGHSMEFIGSSEYIRMALTMTLLAGLFQLMLGIARLGVLVNFVSHTVVIGFTAGAAILIATSQLKNVLGVPIPSGDTFLHTWSDLIAALPQTNFYALSIALVTLIVAIGFKKYLPRWPGMLIAMVVGSLMALFMDAQVYHVKFVPPVPGNLPPLSWPDFSPTTIRLVADSALAIALLGLVEAVSIARSVATRSHQIIDGNQEFIGQGLSNIVGPFFSSYAASGSFTRTGVNYESGAKTPLAAIFAAIALALIVLLIAPLTAYIPIPSMAGILLLVSYSLIDFHHIKVIIKVGHAEAAILLVTLMATLFLELEFAIYAGVLLSLMIYLNRTSKPNIITMVIDPDDLEQRLVNIERKNLPELPHLKIIRIDGSLFFGAVNYVNQTLQQIETPHLLIVCDGINFIDVAGAEMLATEARRRREQGGGLYLVGLKAKANEALSKGGYIQSIEAIFPSRGAAVDHLSVLNSPLHL